MKKPCAIFDIDGTLADNSHRLHFIQSKPKDWQAYNTAMVLDEPIAPMVTLCQTVAQLYPIILMTGRELLYGDETKQWLSDNYISHTLLLMRMTGDYRKDHIIKLDHLAYIRKAGYEPFMVVEDRTSMIRAWRKAGLVALQCADGDY